MRLAYPPAVPRSLVTDPAADGGASAWGSRPHLSVVVPVHNDSRNLRLCLAACHTAATPDAEIIVVDDASTDDSAAVAERAGVRLVRFPRNSGPAAARNAGVRHADGAIIFFVDSDVVVAPGSIRHVLAVFDQHPELTAVFGSYDASPPAPGLVSQYRNLLHHFVHQQGNPDASTFWAGCGAIRRVAFEELGGFDETRFPRPAIEDIELGLRLRRAGHRILLDKTLQATHLKAWTLCSVVRTDIMARALPWSRLILERGAAADDLNLTKEQRVAAGLALLAVGFLALSPLQPAFAGPALGALLGVAWLNRALYAFFRRQRGAWFATAAFPLHLLYYLYSSLTYLAVWACVHVKWCSTVLQRNLQRRPAPAAGREP